METNHDIWPLIVTSNRLKGTRVIVTRFAVMSSFRNQSITQRQLGMYAELIESQVLLEYGVSLSKASTILRAVFHCRLEQMDDMSRKAPCPSNAKLILIVNVQDTASKEKSLAVVYSCISQFAISIS
jgi:hypothetical protein